MYTLRVEVEGETSANIGSKCSFSMGRIAEAIAREQLEKRGYRLEIERRTCPSVCGDGNYLGRETDYPRRNLLREKIYNRKPWCQCDFGRSECPYGERWYDLIRYAQEIRGKTKMSTFWDYYAERNGEEFIVEVKLNSGRLTRPQRHVLEYAEHLGFSILLVKMWGEVNVSIHRFEIMRST